MDLLARLRQAARRHWPALAATAAGLLLYASLALLEPALGTGLEASVLLEEGLKCALLAAFAAMFMAAGRGAALSRGGSEKGLGLPPSVRGLSWGLVAIAVFATAENLAYFAAFPGRGILLRLSWSEPVHLVSGLAEASALWQLLGPGRKKPTPPRPARATAGRLARALAFLGLALAWHLGFNLLADGPIPRLAAGAGPAWRAALVGAALANLAAIIALAYNFAHRVIVGGFLYGQD
jgi:hypothetical protein